MIRVIIDYIKTISRPIRIKIMFSEKEREAMRNRFDYSELAERKIPYSEKDVHFGNKKVIYTCITGGYDNLIVPTFYNSDWDYICFTDNIELLNKKQKGCWRIRPLVCNKYSNAMNNRWHKLFPNCLFPEYDVSIYIDGNIDILDGFLFEEVRAKAGNKILIPIHYNNNCIYKEIRSVRLAKKTSKRNLKDIYKFLKKNRFPKNYGLTENNIIYRKHHDTSVIKVMQEWWIILSTIVPRDQLSLSYVLWKNKIKIDNIYLKNARLEISHFHFYRHK